MQGRNGINKVIYPELSYKIVGILFDVYKEMGHGYQEKHYQKALEIAFSKANIKFKPQCPYRIRYKGEIVGKYFVDFIVDDRIVLEIKRGTYYSIKFFEQVIGYLKATNLKLAILASFTPDGVKFKRVLNLR